MNITKKLVDTFTWAASTDVAVDLPTEGLITRVDFELYTTAGGAVSGALSTHGLWRAIEAFKIQGGGGKNYFSLSGKQMGMFWHFINLVDFPATCWKDIVATSQYVKLRCHFGSRPRDINGRDNPYDLTAAIPAMEETNLQAIWTTGAGADTIDDAVDLSSGTINVTVYEVLGGEKVWSRMVPVSSCYTYNPVGTKSGLGAKLDVPTGGFVRRIGINAQDDTALTSNGRLCVDDQATEFAVQIPKLNIEPLYVRVRQLSQNNPRFDGSQVVNTPNTLSPWAVEGFYILDLRQYDNRDYGLDTRGFKTGDVKLAMTIDSYAAGGTEREYIWYDQVQPYGGA